MPCESRKIELQKCSEKSSFQISFPRKLKIKCLADTVSQWANQFNCSFFATDRAKRNSHSTSDRFNRMNQFVELQSEIVLTFR